MDQGSFLLPFLGHDYKVFYIKEAGLAERALSQLMEKDCTFGFDLETMSYPQFRGDTNAPLDPLKSTPRLVQICDGKNILVFDLTFGVSLSQFGPFLRSKRLLAHNAMFEIQHILQNFKVDSCDIGCTYLATKLLHHALYVDDGGIGAGLDDVMQSLFKVKIFKEINHKFWCAPEMSREQIEYAAIDAAAVLKVAEKLKTGLAKYDLLRIYKLYKEAQWPLARMQLNGMALDSEKHRELIGQWKLNAYEAKKELTKLTGLEELTSHTIAGYLEKNLDPKVLAIWPRTDTGKLSTDANAFSEFSFVPIVKPFAKFQKATILSSTFGMKLQHKINPVDNRIHTNFKLCGTRTGRLSASNPNLQQMPHDKETRSIFVAGEGKTLIVADYGQIELRVAAELSKDKEMCIAYRQGLDLHTLTAMRISGKKTITEDERFKAKALNFGLLFGLGPNKFKHYAKKNYGVEITQQEAFQAVNNWHELYYGYSEWQDAQAAKCQRDLKVRTVTGKLRKLNEDNYYGASANTPVQGSASEVMLNSLVLLYKYSTNNKLINTIHDEIIIECDDNPNTIQSCKAILEELMTDGYKAVFGENSLTKNLVKIGHGPTWADAK